MELDAPSINLIAVGILFGLVQIALLLYIILAKKKHKGGRYFALFLGLLMVAQVESFLNRSGYMGSIPHMLNISTPLTFLFGPLLYFYTRTWLREPISLKNQLVHCIPFLFYFGYSFFFFLQPEAYKYNAFVRSFQPGLELVEVNQAFSADPLNIQGIVVVELISLHLLIYATFTLYQLRKLKLANPEVNLSWPTFGNILMLLGGTILFLSQGGIINGNRFLLNFIPTFSADLFPTFATYALSIYMLKNGFPAGLKHRKYYKSELSNELRTAQLQKVIATVEKDRLYANPNFSLKLLSEVSGLSTHHISQILNEEMGCTFFELTNKYRIEEAKKVLSESTDYIKMEQLAYALGYKSKSTFYTAFKKATRLTPLKYQESKAA